MTEAEVDGFAPYAFKFANGHTLQVMPTQYVYEMRSGVWCMGIYDNQHNGAVIGAATMRNHEVIFDKVGARVAFVPSDCTAMHKGARSSHLIGEFFCTFSSHVFLLQMPFAIPIMHCRFPNVLHTLSLPSTRTVVGGYGMDGCTEPTVPATPPRPPHVPNPSPPPPRQPPPPSPPHHPPSPPKPPNPPSPPHHPPGWHQLPPPSPLPPPTPYQGVIVRAWSAVAQMTSFSGPGPSSRRVLLVCAAIIVACLCCLSVLLYWLASGLLSDDEEDDDSPEGGCMAHGAVCANDSQTAQHEMASMNSSRAFDNSSQGLLGRGGAAPRVRWLPRLERCVPRGYMRAGTDEHHDELVSSRSSAPQFSIDGNSDEEGSDHADSVALSVTVPVGNELCFKLCMPSGASVVIPRPAGAEVGQTVHFELNRQQLEALPTSDVTALLDRRFMVISGE